MTSQPLTSMNNMIAKNDGKISPIILLTMCFGVLMVQIDTSIVNLALKSIGKTFDVQVSSLQWVVDSYNLTYASFLITGGVLGDIYGRKKLFIGGVFVFAIGLLICGLSINIDMLVFGRMISGLGGALLLPNSLTVLTITYKNATERGKAIGIWASCNGLAFAIGPTIGGWIVAIHGWRSIFMLIIPICIATLVLAAIKVSESSSPMNKQLDIKGQILTITFLSSLTLVGIEGSHLGWWSNYVLSGLLICSISFVSLLYFERKTKGPLIAFDLFKNAKFSASMIIAGFMTFGMYALLFLIPFYFQFEHNYSTFMVGILLLPMSLTFIVVSRKSGDFVVKYKDQKIMTTGMSLMGFGLLMIAVLLPLSSIFSIEVALFVIGIGLGLNTGPVMTVAVSSVPSERAGTASSLVNVARMIGATLGVAILGSIFIAYGGNNVSSLNYIAGIQSALYAGALVEFLGALTAWNYFKQRLND